MRLCEVFEEKNKVKEELEGKNNEIQHLSLQRANFIDQLTSASEELMNLREKNEIMQNDLNTKGKINERMMNEKIHYR